MRAMVYMGYGSHQQWGLWPMGTQGAMGYRGIGYIGNETSRGKAVQGVWVKVVRGTWPIRPTGGMEYSGMGYRGYGAHGQ